MPDTEPATVELDPVEYWKLRALRLRLRVAEHDAARMVGAARVALANHVADLTAVGAALGTNGVNYTFHDDTCSLSVLPKGDGKTPD